MRGCICGNLWLNDLIAYWSLIIPHPHQHKVKLGAAVYYAHLPFVIHMGEGGQNSLKQSINTPAHSVNYID